MELVVVGVIVNVFVALTTKFCHAVMVADGATVEEAVVPDP